MTEKMYVANIIEEGKVGGPQVRMVRVAEALRSGVDTTVIMPMENSTQFQKQCQCSGIAYKTLWMSRITKEWRVALRYAFFFPVEIARIVHALRYHHYDLVHVSGGSWQIKGVIASKLAGTKVIWHLNDTSMPFAVRLLFRALGRLADGYIFASQRSQNYYGSLVGQSKPSFVIPAPVDTLKLDPDLNFVGDEALIEKWEGRFVIGTVANVNPVKGLETLIRAAAKASAVRADLYFVIVGPVHKNQEKYYRNLLDLCRSLGLENIEFVGGRSDVRPLLKRFDIYLCSSMAESSPMAVWEAMAMKKPVVSTDVGDVPIYVKNDECGYIEAVGNWSALAARIVLLAEDENKRYLFGEKAREVAVRSLDLRQCAKLHLEAYSRILGVQPN